MKRIHLTNMEIVLEDNKTVYQIGDYIKGKVKLSINGVLEISNIKISLDCIGEVKWVENPGTRYHRDGHVYHERKNLLNINYRFPDEVDHEILVKGDHELSFKFQLPERDLPTSFVSTHGCVTYYIESVIEEPIIDDIHRTGLEIAVEAPFRDNLMISVGGSIEKELGMLNMGSGKLILYANVNKKGHIPGELVEVHCTVENESSGNVTPRVTLYQTQIFMSGERHKTIETALSDAVIGSLVESNRNNTETIFVLIPDYVSLSIKSSLISVKYFIHVTLDIPHAIDLHKNLPIVVTNKYAINALKSIN